MITVFKLVNKYFWKGMIGPLFAFFVPLIVLFFLGTTLGQEFYFAGGITISVLTMGLVFVPQSIFEFKNSSLLKRIGTTPINPSKFLFVIIAFNFIVIIISIIFVFIFSFLVFSNTLNSSKLEVSLDGTPYVGASWLEMLAGVDWPSFLYSIFLLIFLTMSFGVLIASVARSTLFIQGVGITFMLITFFVAPAILPIAMTNQIDVIKYASYLLPFKYPISLIAESFNGFDPTETFQGAPLQYIMNIGNSNIWDINNDYVVYNVFSTVSGQKPGELIIFRGYDKILNHVIPFIFIGIFGFFAIGKFSWSTRSSSKMNWKILTSLFRKKDKKNRSVRIPDLQSKYIIEAHNISKTFNIKGKKIDANQDISINFKAGQSVAILGSNGAGKTTFIEMMVGLNKPTSGYFQYNYKTKVNYQESLGIQFQDSSYPVGLKCKDIVLFLKDAYKINISNEELNNLVKEFGIDKFYNKDTHSLSGGQQQRLNLLLAILHKPKLVFLDELSTGLDIKIRTTIKKFIKKFADENNMTIVLISHNMAEVDYLTERIIIFQEGKIVVDELKSNILETHDDLESFLEPYL